MLQRIFRTVEHTQTELSYSMAYCGWTNEKWMQWYATCVNRATCTIAYRVEDRLEFFVAIDGSTTHVDVLQQIYNLKCCDSIFKWNIWYFEIAWNVIRDKLDRNHTMGCGQSKIHLYPRKSKSKANGKKSGHSKYPIPILFELYLCICIYSEKRSFRPKPRLKMRRWYEKDQCVQVHCSCSCSRYSIQDIIRNQMKSIGWGAV